MNDTLTQPAMLPMEPLPTRLSPAGKLPHPMDCLMCDIYGTLFISGSGDISLAGLKDQQHQGIDALLAKYHINMTPADLTRSLHTAIQAEHEEAKHRGVNSPEVRIDKIWATILPISDGISLRSFAVEYEMIVNPVWPMPGLNALINYCNKQSIRLGIISNAQFYTPLLFEWYLGKDLSTLGFDPRLTFYSFEYGRAKPSRFLFQMAVDELQQLGIPVDRVAFIGNDLRNDIAPARDMGFRTILFAGDARSLRMREDDPTCRNVNPDLRITQLTQLASYLTME